MKAGVTWKSQVRLWKRETRRWRSASTVDGLWRFHLYLLPLSICTQILHVTNDVSQLEFIHCSRFLRFFCTVVAFFFLVARTQRHENVRPTAAVNNSALWLDSSMCPLTQWWRSELSSLYSMQLFIFGFFHFFIFALHSQLCVVSFILYLQFWDIFKKNDVKEPAASVSICWCRWWTHCVTDDRTKLGFISRFSYLQPPSE